MSTEGDNESKAADASTKPELHVMIYNIQKSKNAGNIVRSAVAFGASNLIGR